MTPFMTYVKTILQDAIRRIDNDECSEETLSHLIAQTNAESKGYFGKGSFVNYDQAMKILGIGNRVTLKAYLDRHNVRMNKINNMSVGFLRSEVEALAEKKFCGK